MSNLSTAGNVDQNSLIGALELDEYRESLDDGALEAAAVNLAYRPSLQVCVTPHCPS